MIEIMPGLPENVVAAVANGKITGEDYEKVLIPAIEDKIRTQGKIRMLYQLGPNFTGFTYNAMWDDAKVGIWHLTAFEKIAVVSDVDWIIDAVKVFKFAIPCPVKTFRNKEFAEAKAWISE
ncbi:TPA: STAS/SEC14 domain-containing protein [Methanosarcina acetivorans]|uniref:STAS/SEC14 domain-containing protein n=2 Tax=Methanosarcina acetivorans TaxID=2214 RepID=Q8TPB5_METAC|nr:STAS/SEC14 domain-containing protein [Methanosarcina acetivorans]AAM05401.1 predicted protein [Methanosarcina acetivorans C2A]HIH92724.1 STAS/SEC14 domain-containing protein [Methanosarcina acetivorans]